METFTASYSGAALQVRSSIANVFSVTEKLASPPFELSEGEKEDTSWQIIVDLATESEISAMRAGLRKDPVRLRVTTHQTEYLVDEYSADRIALLKLEYESSSAYILVSYPGERRWELKLGSTAMNDRRVVARLLKLYFGALAQARGDVFFHASAVEVEGHCYLFAGQGGQGKTSLMYLACSRLGARFVTDDLVVFQKSKDTGASQSVTGWPKRIALGISLLCNEPAFERVKAAQLRREGLDYSLQQGKVRGDWSRKNRVAFDQDEFFEIFGVRPVYRSAPRAIVLPHSGPEVSQWNVVRVAAKEAAAIVEENLASNIQLKYMTDFLGLTGLGRKRQDAEHLDMLRSLPMVRATFGAEVGGRFAEFWDDVMSAVNG